MLAKCSDIAVGYAIWLSKQRRNDGFSLRAGMGSTQPWAMSTTASVKALLT